MDYEPYIVIKKSNFKCLNSHNNEDCNHSYCKNKTQSEPSCIYGLKDLDPHSHGGCKYWENKSDCIDSDVALLNYNVLMTDNQYMNHYPDRDIMICDEAHNIESKIM